MPNSIGERKRREDGGAEAPAGRPAADPTEAARLKLEINSLRTELAFKNQMIRLLNQVNANMRASLKTPEVHYLILMSVIVGPGLRLNRAMLFIRDPKDRTLHGALAISPDTADELFRFYEEADAKQFGLEDYLKRFYDADLKVTNRLSRLVTSLRCPRSTANLLTETLNARQPFYHRRPRASQFAGLKRLQSVLKGEFITAPILCGNEELGVIVADNHFTRKALTPADCSALQTLGKFASSLIIAARKAEEADQLSIADELTKAANFRELKLRVEHELERGRRYHRQFSLCLLDLDDFRLFNELNGHVCGNKALIDVVHAIHGRIRAVDLLARYGGDRFAALLPETDKPGAMVVADKVCGVIRRKKFSGMERLPGKRLTLSASVATFPEDGADFDALTGYLSRLMHLAKAAGKNQVQAESLEIARRKSPPARRRRK